MEPIAFICIGALIGYCVGISVNKIARAERDERIKQLENEIRDLINLHED